MHAIAAVPGSLEPQFWDLPEPGLPAAGEVLCRTVQLGVCGTDRDILESSAPWVPPGQGRLVLGHECLARIEAVGAGVEQFAPGDLVVPVVRRATGCPTHRVDMLAFGQYTERGIAFEDGFSAPLWIDQPRHLFAVPPEIACVAVLTEPLSVAEKGVNEALVLQRARLDASVWTAAPPRVLVTGMGPIGFAAVVACRCRDWPVVMFGRDPDDSFRAELAVRLGASYCEARRFQAEPGDVEQDGFDLILECTGSDEVVLRVTGALASRGVLVWLGSSRVPVARQHNVDLLLRHGILRNHLHVGCVNAAPRDFADALVHLQQMFATHRDDMLALLTAEVAPSDSLWHYRHRQPQGIKTVLAYE